MVATNTAPTAPLYTELPYPADGVIRTTAARIMRRMVEQRAPHLLSKPDLALVDVGCGTGEVTAGYAQTFPNARVFAVDINPASLEHAERLARRSNLNITFVQADITGDLAQAVRAAGGGEFDLVSSMGVLHHLPEPAAGFAAVRELIRPDGCFLCYIYSKFGRWDDMAVRKLLDDGTPADSGFERRAAYVSALQLSNRFEWSGFFERLPRRLRYGPPLVLTEVMGTLLRRRKVTHVSDHFSNPVDHFYTFGELAGMLTRTGWSEPLLADQGGLPVRPEQFTRNPVALAALRAMPRDVLYDYFAFVFRAAGFNFSCRPAP